MAATDGSSSRADLAALFSAILPRLAELEAPILSSAGLSMWEYAILTELVEGTALAQIELSRRVRRDPTRLGRHLDELEARGLVTRGLAADKRQRLVRPSETGQGVQHRARLAIRTAEDDLLSQALTSRQARALRDHLDKLARACRSS